MVTYIRSDLDFILQQILIAEADAAGADLSTLLPNSFVPFGLRTVDGSFNNLVPGQSEFGAADNLFPRMTDPVFRDALAVTVDLDGPGGQVVGDPTSYDQTTGFVFNSQPRTISNLIVDQTITNPAAVQAYVDAGFGILVGDVLHYLNDDGSTGLPVPPRTNLNLPNTTPDEGLSAPFNLWFVFFGQFFDHGLDLLQKGGNGTVFIPLQADDPLIAGADGILVDDLGTAIDESADNLPAHLQFMVLTRATQVDGPGADGILGDDPTTVGVDESLDDTTHESINTTSPFVDQNQTYTSHPSHQVFLREYQFNAALDPVATGKLITNRDLVDGEFGNGNDADLRGMSTWAVVKAQARDMLGIELSDYDVVNVPMIRVDPYGNFIPGANGFAQLVVGLGPDGIAQTDDDVLLEGDPNANGGLGVSTATALRTGQMFLADIAHSANPFSSQTGTPLTADADGIAGVDDGLTGTYDDELLGEHFMAGDGRVNENIGLTTVHHVFHAEHNRLVEHTKDVALADAQLLLAGGATEAEAVAFLNNWLADPITTLTAATTKVELTWNGERLFQAAKFGTEMQYQHLVFEEFARKVQPMVDVFLAPEGFDTTINPAIVAEFAHTVYRFGHSMLTETIDRLDPNFVSSEVGLIQAFLNPLMFATSGPTPDAAAGAIIRGLTRQVGNEIDEFVTEALRNNLVGLPLDLPAINLARGRDTGIPSLNAARAQFFAMTGDSQLTPYTSWADFVQNLKHPESLINFIAAYGTHISITTATTLADKRAAATLIVLGGVGAPSDRLDFLNATGSYIGDDNLGGLNNIDFWIGGLAEKQMPFGGLLGSTFNFVFETQMEALQNGDRFYYLARTAGMNFINELENNSFAKLIMANTDATHLPADVFSTPAFILEVDRLKQHTGLDDIINDTDGIVGNSDPTGGIFINGVEITKLVIRDNPATAVSDTNYLQYTGVDHVVLGGTPGDDIIISSIGDDTLWGDGGNDRLEGGDGVDNIEGGAGDDIITDMGGDDILKGNDGNDVISGGNGFNLIIGGAGSDFIITGEDVSETFGGTGNDFILGAQMNLPTFGNEGDDWIEIGTSDGAGGDNFDPQEAGTVIGHDVFITGGGFDEADGEGGDDIMVMSDGEDHFGGGGGFDWASYKNDKFGVTVDMTVNDFIEPPVAPSNQGLLDRFAQVEGLAGSAFGDVLRGDDADAAEINTADAQNSALNQAGIDRIAGLQDLLGPLVTSFFSGNILLGGGGSDIIEGRGGDDVIDGDRTLNVRVGVTGHVPAPGQPIITSVDSLTELVPYMLSGEINPSQLSIVREILPGATGFDTAVFSGNRADYDIAVNGAVTTGPFNVGVNDIVTVTDNSARPIDGTDRLTHVERLQFADLAVVLTPGLNAEPVGVLTLNESAPQINQILTVSAADVIDADNPGGTITGGPISFVWQVELVAGSGVFTDIVALGAGNPATALGNTFRVTPDLAGLALRARAIYQDAHGVLENVFSAPTTAVTGVAGIPLAPVLPTESATTSPGGGLHLIRADLQFILDQIKFAEGSPDGNVLDAIANSRLPFGLRTVDGTFNNLVQGQTNFGAADQNFPLLLDQVFRNDQDGDTFDPDAVGPAPTLTNTNYAALNALGAGRSVIDADPRIISNLIVDQTITNPVAVQAFVDAGFGILLGDVLHYLNDNGTPGDVVPPSTTLTLPNRTPDEGLSAGFNSWFTFFGQFFDHGLDLVDKGGNGTVFMPLQTDDPLYDFGANGVANDGLGADLIDGNELGDLLDDDGAGADGLFGTVDDSPNFMALTRATNTTVSPGADLILGTSDDVHTHNNETTPFVDQNQTYTSHPSHQVFLREYATVAGKTVATGKMLDGVNGGIGNWAEVKAQALDMLGVALSDFDVHNVPLLRTDAYGKFIPDPVTGYAQVIVGVGDDGIANTTDDVVISGNPLVPVSTATALRTGHAFLNDIAHHAAPGIFDTDGNPGTPGIPQVADSDAGPEGLFGDDHNPATYDNEMLDRHLVTGDGRGNENIGLTSVHFIFHAEHNRMVGHIKDVAIASNDAAFVNQWLLAGPLNQINQAQLDAINAITDPVAKAAAIDALSWNGEHIFQAARFSTEMQYQHLVFEEFARKVQPQVDVFLMEGQGYNSTINAAIVAEFAHAVYRFGHSLLPDTIDRLDANFASSEIGLIEAFLNPLVFTASGATPAEAAGAIIRGVTRQPGNEIDELVTEAVRNNLLGLPLDLPAINLARGRDTGVPTLNQARTEFYSWTGDSQLKPYTSWADFVQHLKHPGSLINFIAAYGTHEFITGATTLADKRAAATLLVLGDGDDSDGVTIGANIYTDRLDFLNATGAYTPDGSLGTNDDSLGGLNNIDLWVGGLAEKQMPFGGLLGSTFNYVFENQMEKLQNGDRFYYLERTAGLNFLTELENNSFAKLIMANTDTTHLPGDVFSTPAFTLEVDQSKQFTGIENVQQAIGQSGTVTVEQLAPGQWHSVTFAGPIEDAVVVMMVNTAGEFDPAVARVRNVTANGFEFQVDEWEHYDEAHVLETLSWLAMSAGNHVLPDGTHIRAGYNSVDNTLTDVSFGTDFTDALNAPVTPVVLTQVTGVADPSTVTTRLTDVTASGFRVRVQEEQLNEIFDPAHGTEQVGWIAIAQGVTATAAADSGNMVGNNPQTILYGLGASFSLPVFLAQMQTQLDADTAAVRGIEFDDDSARVFVQEETSADPFTDHTDEDVGFVALSTGVILPGIPIFNADPTEGGTALTPLVIRNNPATPGLDSNYLQYTGEDHVVLGGTPGDDIIISSIGDDTLYGDAGNDRLEGGDGVDMILGGAGDDIITDRGGDDNLQGQDGNDAIHGGNGINLILGGFGNDFIVTGEDESEAFGGPGNDFIFGVKPVEMLFGNEGDDWLEHGMADGSAGENFDTRGLDSIIGNDVFIGDTVADRMLGEGGDDIMVGNGGQVDRYIGSSGFDWAVFKHDTLAANADLNLRAFDEAPVPQSVASILSRFESVEGLSGSQFSDILRGDDADAAAIAVSGFTGSVLTNFGLIEGLDAVIGVVDDLATSFGAGNIILGGDGSDLIEGRGGDDIIDGDLALNVRIRVVQVDANGIPVVDGDGDQIEIDTADSMTELTDRVFSGEINPGQLVIVREILQGSGAFNFDTAVFSGNLADYTIDIADRGTPDLTDDVITVTHNDATALNGIGIDGVDTLTHIERLQFSDQSVVLVPGLNSEPVGLLAILDASGAAESSPVTPVFGQVLRVSTAGVTDADNVATLGAITGPISFVWQFERIQGTGIFEDIIIATGLGDVRATGETFTVTEDLGALALRVRALYQDANGVLETVFSAPTAPVEPPEPPVIIGTLDADTLAGTDFSDIIIGLGGADVIDGGRGSDTIFGDSSLVLTDGVDGDDVIGWRVGDGRDLIDGGGNTAVGDTFDIRGDGVGDTFRVFSRVGLLPPEAAQLAALGSLDPLTKVVVTRQAAGGLETIIAELRNIELIVLNNTALTGLIADGTAVGGDTVTVIGDFLDTGLALNGSPVGMDIFLLGVEENAKGAILGSVFVHDPNPGDTFTFTISDSRFEIVDSDLVTPGQQLVLKLKDGVWLDFEAEQQVELKIDVFDQAELASKNNSYEYTVNVTDVVAENVTGSMNGETILANVGADRLNGSGGDDVLQGGLNADRLNGGEGNDRFIATIGDGNDRYDGGAGIDTYDLSLTTANANVNLASGRAFSAQTGSDRLASIENVAGSQGRNIIVGSSADNILDGKGGNDSMGGGAGSDTLLGGAGNDRLNGGLGDDKLDGGAGNDTLIVNVGNDTIVLSTGFGNDTVRGFDANATGGQDLIDLRGLVGITAADFAPGGDVTISDEGSYTLVTIGTDGTLRLVGVNGNGENVITQADFLYN